MEKKPEIGYFGREGSNTQQAAEQMYSGSLHGYPTIPDVFRAVMKGEVDAAVVPIENSVEGSVGITNDLLYRDDLYITGEYYMKITHCLIARPGTARESIRTVISHPQALGQCSTYIAENRLTAIPFPDTASAVSALGESRYAGAAAIASERAAEIYSMEILERDMGDFPDNYTRFVSLSREPGKFISGRRMKVSVVVSLENRPGSLMKALEIFHRHGVNLTRIESRPVKFSPWKYIFFLDAEMSPEKASTLEELEKNSLSYKFLGVYPRD